MTLYLTKVISRHGDGWLIQTYYTDECVGWEWLKRRIKKKLIAILNDW